MEIGSILSTARFIRPQVVSQTQSSEETSQSALEEYLEELEEELEEQLLGISSSTNPDGVGGNVDLTV